MTKRRSSCVSRVALVGVFMTCTLPLSAQTPRNSFFFELEAEEMEGFSTNLESADAEMVMWALAERAPARGGAWLAMVGKKNSQDLGSATKAVSLPDEGTYYIWVRHAIHPTRAKTFAITIQDQELPFAYEAYGFDARERPEIYGGPSSPDAIDGLAWSKREVNLAKGESTLVLGFPSQPIEGDTRHPAQVDSIVITNDPHYSPE